MKRKWTQLAFLAATIFGVAAAQAEQEAAQGLAQNTAQEQPAQTVDLAAVQLELENAKQAVEDARQVAEQIVQDAQNEAAQIRQAGATLATPADLEPVAIRNAHVAVEMNAGTVEEIVTALMPLGWRVMVDVKDQSLMLRRFQFVSTKSRDQALRDLLMPMGLKHQYFFDLKDAGGAASPLLVVSKNR